MNTAKLKEALTELQHQRKMLDQAIRDMERIIRSVNGSSSLPPTDSNSQGSYIDLGVQILEETGSSMHVKEITRRIGEIKGKKISRASVETSFVRHIKSNGDNGRLKKVGPSQYALIDWPIS